jgi:hypothetical protein
MNEKSRDTCNIGNTTLKEDIQSKNQNQWKHNSENWKDQVDLTALDSQWKYALHYNCIIICYFTAYPSRSPKFIPGFCSGRRWSSLGWSPVFVVVQHWEHNIEGRYTKQKSKPMKTQLRKLKRPSRPLQKPGMKIYFIEQI